MISFGLLCDRIPVTIISKYSVRSDHYFLKGVGSDNFQKIPEQKELLEKRLCKGDMKKNTI